MSRASKITLAVTSLATAGIVYFVHWAQERDRAVKFPIVATTLGLFAFLMLIRILCLSRHCMPVSSATRSGSALSGNDKRNSRCRGSWRKSTERSRKYLTVGSAAVDKKRKT